MYQFEKSFPTEHKLPKLSSNSSSFLLETPIFSPISGRTLPLPGKTRGVDVGEGEDPLSRGAIAGGASDHHRATIHHLDIIIIIKKGLMH